MSARSSVLSSPPSSASDLSSIPSSPLSKLSSTPSPPPGDYPSPLSSHDATETLPVLASQMTARSTPEFTISRDHEGAPPAKRQKTTAKARDLKKTEYLDLRALGNSDDESLHKKQDPKLKRLVDALRNKKKIVVIAGAGISTTAGIPDFRSSTGLFKTLRGKHDLKSSGKHLFDASVYKDDSSTSSFHDMVRELAHLTQSAEPTPFHHMLATIAEEGRLMRLYTQNVDGIDVALEPLKTAVPLNLKGPWPTTIQLHGGLGKMVCTLCNTLYDFDGALFEGPEAPPCPECKVSEEVRSAASVRSRGIGRLRPRMVLYNEHNPDEDAIGAASCADLKSRPDAVIVVGTSLKVPGIRRLAREMCSVARDKRGGFTAWINHDPEPTSGDVKDCWDMVVTGDCDSVAQHVNLPKWHEKNPEFTLIGKQQKIEAGQFTVVLKGKQPEYPTPADSPLPQSPMPPTEPNVTKPTALKQMSLPFASTPLLTTAKNGKLQKKKGRKALPSNAPIRPTGITAAFSTTKTTTTQSIKKTSKDSTTFPKTMVPNDVSKKRSVLKIKASVPRHKEIPQTPSPNLSPKSSNISVEVPFFNRNEIIKPTGGSPKGMANLLC